MLWNNLKPQNPRGDGARREGAVAPKREPAEPPRDAEGIFRGVPGSFVPHGVQSRRLEGAASPPFRPRPICLPFVLRAFGLQVWKQKLVQMGGRLEKKDADAKGARINHVLAADAKALLRELGADWLHRFPGVMASYSPRPPLTP